MTAGATLYLVSACGSADEFVAAFRRYADRTGLFIPASAPLPAGRRGRLALTLKDGGVMIEGEAEIVQSSAKPTVLYGRPGMTIKFLAPDDPSKTVIAQLEKARLAMKPAPLSVPPRPAEIPAEPRPVVPAVGGRIDAANALAECVVIGDPASLREPNAPRAVADSPSGRKFIVPEIPGAPGSRPKSPTAPPGGRPKTPTAPPDPEARMKTPTVPPDPASKPVPVPAQLPPSRPLLSSVPSSKLTSIGFPAIDKLPAAPSAPVVPVTQTGSGRTVKPAMISPDNPLLKTVPGTGAPAGTRQARAKHAPLTDDEATAIGEAPPGAVRNTPTDAATAAAEIESTDIATPPPAPSSGIPSAVPVSESSRLASDAVPAPTTDQRAGVEPPASGPLANAEARPGSGGLLAPPPPPAPAPAPPPPRAPAAPLPSVSASAKHKATSIGFPAIRTPFETQGVGVVPPPSGTPAAPHVPPGRTDATPRPPQPRAKTPTRPPAGPRQPTPYTPLPVVRNAPKSAAPVVEEEATEINSGAPTPPSAPPSSTPETVVAHAAYQDAAKAADAAASEPSRSGGMRASEILRAIPTADWTMTPDASKPTIMPSKGWTPIAGTPAVQSPPEPAEGPDKDGGSDREVPKGPPTGDWTIQLDPSAPEAGWSPPAKPEKPAPKPKSAGNPDIAVASKKPIVAQQWEDKPTTDGAKIEIDPTLMEPLAPMPSDEDGEAGAAAPAEPRPATPTGPSPFAAPPVSGRAGTEPLAGLGAVLRQPSAPQPLVGSRPQTATAADAEATATGEPDASPFAAPPPARFVPPVVPIPNTPPQSLFDPNAQAQMFGFSSAHPAAPASNRKRTLLIVVAAIVALGAGFALVLVLSGRKQATSNGASTQGSGSDMQLTGNGSGAGSQVTPPIDNGSAGSAGPGSGSAAAMVDTNSGSGSGSASEAPVANDGPCKVSVASAPKGADILVGKAKVGTTPADIELPCGAQATIVLKKARFESAEREVTPTADKPTKVSVRLSHYSVMVRVTSSPPGATIMVGGKNMGVTPARIRLPAFERTSVVLTKPGYASDTTRLVPKKDNTLVTATLKKGKR